MEKADERLGESLLVPIRKTVSLALSLAMSSSVILFAQNGLGVSGTVRDLRGRPQTGVLIELLGSATTTTALTDVAGHYQIKGVPPGVYQLRATAALYLPSLQRQLRIEPDLKPVVNVTMHGFLDGSRWGAFSQQGSVNDEDDWKWTLRSPANRPLLRLASNDVCPFCESEPVQNAAETRGAVSVTSSAGAFGSLERVVRVAIAHQTSDQKRVLEFRTQAANGAVSVSQTPISSSVLLQSDSAAAGMSRATMKLRTFPQLTSGQGDPLTVLEFGAAKRLTIGDFATVEAGSETQYLRCGSSALLTHPFLRITTTPLAGWVTAIGFATSSNVSHYDDLGKEGSSVPTVIASRGGLTTEAESHVEAVAQKRVGRVRAQLVYERSALKRMAISGKLKKWDDARAQDSLLASDGVVLDRSNGTFRVFGPGSSANGYGMALDFLISDSLTVSGGYLSGTGISLQPTPSADGGSRFVSGRSNAFLASVNGRVTRTGTLVNVTYRWQPSDRLTTISPDQTSSTEPYLGIHLRQDLPMAKRFTNGVSILVDGDNLAGEGSHNFPLAQQEVSLMSALREIKAGLALTF